MADPYQTLGVSKGATADELKSAYRKLAKKLHPDVNPGRKDIETKFKEVTAAYDLLSDQTKRSRYDRGEIDAMGNERAYSRAGADPFAGGMRGSAGGRGRTETHTGGGGFSAEDIFAEFFGGNKRNAGRQQQHQQQQQQQQYQRGADVTYTLGVPFIEAIIGEKKRITLSNGKTVDVNIPPGTEEGHKLRLRGQGMPGNDAGDAIIEVHIEPHAYFTRKDADIHLEVPITLQEALTGASIKIPTLDGQVAIKVPKHANTGSTLRLKAKGVPRPSGEPGDMFVKLKVLLPENPSDDFVDFIDKWSKKHPYDPRKKLGWS